MVVGDVLLNDVGSRPGPIEEGHFVVGDAGSGRVHGRHPALVGGAIRKDEFGDDVEVVWAYGGSVPQEVVAFVPGGGRGQAQDQRYVVCLVRWRTRLADWRSDARP